MVVFVILSIPLGQGYCALTHPFLTMYLTLCDLDPDKSRGRFDFMQALVAIVLVCQNVATKLLVQWRWDWLSEEIGFAVCFGAMRMETNVDMARAFIEFALCWCFVDWAKSARLGETIDLGSFRLGPNFCIILE